MKLAEGQRWHFVWGSYSFIVEIIEPSTMDSEIAKCKVVQTNPYASERGFSIGYTDTWHLNGNSDFRYLEGQDKPI